MSVTFSITNYPTGIGPSSVAIGDLNGDGLPDLVTGNLGFDPSGDIPTTLPPGTVSVLLGNGGDTFSAATPYPTGSVLPFSVAIGDLNGDGHLDLAVANYGDPFSIGDGSISVFLGNGDGALSAATQYPTGTFLPGAQSVAIADLNGDGRQDLVVANASNRISVLLGDGVGGFLTQTPLSFTGLNNPSSVAIGDLNGDGRLDLAVANFGTDTGSGAGTTVSVLYGKDGGGFNQVQLTTGGTNPSSVAIGDLNGDGHLDLAAANAGSNAVSVFLNDGIGNLVLAATPYATGTNPESVAIGDLNGDGRPDLAVANHDSNTVSVLLGNAGGGFQAQTQYATGTEPSSVAIADLNGDGQLDLAVANVGSDNVTVLLNTSSPTNDAPVAVNDSYNVDEDNVLTVAAPGVLEGDTDADGDPLSAVLVSGPLNGSLSLNTDGSFTYTPDANFNGTDSFTYSANDGEANSNVATVAITINSANDTPTDIALSANTVPENSLIGTVIGNLTASDPDTGDSLAFTLVDSAGGLFGINGTSLMVTGALDYEEATSHDITVRVTDSANSSYDETFTIDITNVGGVTITGTARADTINAITSVGGQLPPTNEEDTITGGKGKDTIEALGGNDVVKGGRDADRLTGGSGNDVLSGGEGKDTFVFAPGFGNDVIQDFEAGKEPGDVIEIDHNIFADFADILANSMQDGSNVVITADAENSIALVNVSLANLNANDFHFV